MQDFDEAPPNIVALLREGAEKKLRVGSKEKLWNQSILSSLSWRDKYINDSIVSLTVGNRVLQIQQYKNGEMKGVGTGATIWPAAICLLRYLEKTHFEKGMNGRRVLDLGCGTGAVGIAASVLGAQVTLSDQYPVLRLAKENADVCGFDQSIVAQEYNWGTPCDILMPPFDIIVVSDCILPKLYPIEPLVKTISDLCRSGHPTCVLVSYEHRYYDKFNPKTKFIQLLQHEGLSFRKIPENEQHQRYLLDDVELWEFKNY